MLDIKMIKENPDEIKKLLEERGQEVLFGELLEWEEERKQLNLRMDNLREKRNKTSEEVGKMKKQGKEPSESLVNEMNAIREEIKEKERFMVSLEQKIEDFLLRVPNLPDQTVPRGKNANQNKIIRESGKMPLFDFNVKPHWELGEKLGILSFETAAKIAGARFAFLKGMGCALERALITFMLDIHLKKGYVETMPPYLVNKTSMQGTGQLPKFEEEAFKCRDDEYYLIPTAEVPAINVHRDEIIDEKIFPIKYVAYTACFRREAGSYGKDTKGLIRNHQFNKVELVKFTKPEDSAAELESLLADAEEVLKKLKLVYRVVELCTADLGFAAAKTYDLEIWMPGEKRWREVSSCSNCKDFQARRLNIKVRRQNKQKDFVHTLNASGVAIGRVFAAVLENYQQEDGSIAIPEVLQKYMDTGKIDKTS